MHRRMSILSPIVLAAVQVAAGPATQPATQPTTAQASRSEIKQLVADLGSPDFKTRERADDRLRKLGESANAELIEHVTDPNEEIASRVVALLGKPKDPALRVELAVRLLSTADPDWMEKGVYLLFDSPREIIDLYRARTKDAQGIQRVIFNIVGEQLRSWKKMNDVFLENYERIKRKDPQAAERLLETGRDSNFYDAEAAYWSAVEAVEDYRVVEKDDRAATSQPASHPR